jgi:phage/plasmid primase-like uncharacterized protein
MTRLDETIVPDDGDPPERQLRDAIISAGIVPPEVLIFDGKLRRFCSDGKKPSKNGYYVAHRDGVPAGFFGCWKAGVKQGWRATGLKPMTAAEDAEYDRWLEHAKALRDAEERRRHEVAADVIEEIWEGAPEATGEHPYLARKGVQPNGARVTGDGRLIVPLFSPEGDLASLQYIDSDGGKLFHAGTSTRGGFWVLGALSADKTTYVAEGFATGATIHEVTGKATVVAYGASNLEPVTGSLRELLGERAELVVVADNDKGGHGLRHAEQATAKHGGRYVMPPLLGDANDYRAAGRDLAALLTPSGHPAKSWLVRATDFAAQPAPIAWLVKGWIQANAMLMVHGPSGHGKTFAVLDWCCRIAAGTPDWRGCRVRAGDVVYLAGEGHHGLRGRIAAWMAHHGASPDRMLISESGCDLDTPQGLRKAVDAITAWSVRPSLIVVDTLHRFLAGDENSAQDARGMLESCAELMGAFGCSVCLVHHTGNSEDAKGRARGSSAWRGALDGEISISKAPTDDTVIVIAQKKSKDAEMLPDLHAALRKVKISGWIDEDGMPVSSAVMVEETAPSPRTKSDKATEGHRKAFESAWWASGAESDGPHPYLSRSALESFLVSPEGGGLRPSSATQALKSSGAGIIGKLLAAGFVSPARHGWIIVDPAHSSALMLAKKF